jgi:hypothetical protein
VETMSVCAMTSPRVSGRYFSTHGVASAATAGASPASPLATAETCSSTTSISSAISRAPVSMQIARLLGANKTVLANFVRQIGLSTLFGRWPIEIDIFESVENFYKSTRGTHGKALKTLGTALGGGPRSVAADQGRARSGDGLSCSACQWRPRTRPSFCGRRRAGIVERETEGEKVGRALIEGLCVKEMRLGPSAWQPCPWAWPACFARVMTAVGAVC